MFKTCPSRAFYFTQFLAIAALLAFGFYLEYVDGLMPCALCELQRVFFVALGVEFLIASLFAYRRSLTLIFTTLQLFTAILGALVAARQVYLQYSPPTTGASCEASLSYLLHVLPFHDAIMNVLLGGPECSRVTWQFLHLSIAEWSLLAFSGFSLLALNQGIGALRRR